MTRINNSIDLGIVAAAYGKRFTLSGYDAGYSRLKDANGDRVINSIDLGITASYYGPAPRPTG